MSHYGPPVEFHHRVHQVNEMTPCNEKQLNCINSDAMDKKYLEKRRRNNLAVRKSREKLRIRMSTIKCQIRKLQVEQKQLTSRLKQNKIHFDILNDLYLEACSVSSLQNEANIHLPPRVKSSVIRR